MDLPDAVNFPLSAEPDDSLRIESSLDSTIGTPVNYNWNLSFGRDLPGGMYFEASYIGRKARDLMATRDIMQFNNLVDPQSGIDFYTAAAQLYYNRVNNTPIDQMASIPFFENLFPYATWYWDPSFTPTQNIFSFVSRDGYDILDWTYLQSYLNYDGIYPNMFFQPQYGALSTWSTIAKSDYHGLAVTFRERFRDSLTFDVNYTWSKSMDNASGLQNEGAWGAGFILNPFRPDDFYSVSDFDIQQMLNANWLWQLPFGRGRTWGSDMSGVADAILGGWGFNGIFRWNSGLPVSSPAEAGRWATNWQLSSYSVRIRDPKVDPTKSGDHPNFFADPQYAYNSLRDAMAGESGDRNVLRRSGYIALDFGLSKRFTMPYAEGHALTFRWEVFNATNTQRLGFPSDSEGAYSTAPDPQIGEIAPTFGYITSIQGQPRVMQFGLRYDF
jgi:hypothetical protein